MDNLIGIVILIAISMMATVIVLSSAIPTVSSTTKSSEIKSAESAMLFIKNAVEDVIKEGAGSSRIISLVTPGGFETIPEENSIVYSAQVDFEVMQYLSRKYVNSILYISGNNVNCFEADENADGSTDLVIENNLLRAAFAKTARATPLQAINTKNAIISMKEKSGNTTISFVNTSVYVNNFSSSVGTGYSEILKLGRNMPFCQVHFLINSTVVYDLYYKLYSGADFIVAEVKNIR